MVNTEKLKVFWSSYCNSLTNKEKQKCNEEHHFDAWSFGNSKEWANSLGKLVLDGTKTATAASLWEYEYNKWKMPEIGSKIIILDGDEQPLCIIQATEITIKQFNKVDFKFAADEGEGFKSAEDWRSGHWKYYKEPFKEMGLELDESMPMMCMRFKLIYSKTGSNTVLPGTQDFLTY